MFHALGETGRLDGEDLAAARLALFIRGGNERFAVVSPADLFRCGNRRLFRFQDAEFRQDGGRGTVGKRTVAQPGGADARQIDVGGIKDVFALEPFGIEQDRAVFRDDAMSAADDIGGGFMDAGGSVSIDGDAACAQALHQTAAVIGLADQFVAGGKVQQQRGGSKRLQ